MKYFKKIVEGKDIKTVPYIFSNKEKELRYIKNCDDIFGCVPCDVEWAIGSKLYKEKILNDGISNFGDPIEWQKEERKDRKID